jgi:hypothetical protein
LDRHLSIVANDGVWCMCDVQKKILRRNVKFRFSTDVKEKVGKKTNTVQYVEEGETRTKVEAGELS